MEKPKHILILDVGTTNIKAFVFDMAETICGRSQFLMETKLVGNDIREQDPLLIITASKKVIREAVEAAGITTSDIVGMGITTQRETVVAWDKHTGKPFYPAILWKDTRTKDFCDEYARNHTARVSEKTGLPIIPYFSASKMNWILSNVPDARRAMENDSLQIGTVDTWIAWNMCDGHPYVTDYTNASRTLLFNIHACDWDDELCNIFGIQKKVLSKPVPCSGPFGTISKEILGASIPLIAICGDQQASLYAAGKEIGTTKVTYGTGTFIMEIIGDKFHLHEPFLTTLTAHPFEKPFYALEFAIHKGAAEINSVSSDEKALFEMKSLLYKSAREYLDKLPYQITKLVVDGGISADHMITELHREKASYPVREHEVYDGTALGMCRMVRDILI